MTEVTDGIAKARREGATRKAADLTAWWNLVEHLYASRILAFDLRAATIAGTAKAHDLAVLARNRKDFAGYGLLTTCPFQADEHAFAGQRDFFAPQAPLHSSPASWRVSRA